MAGSLFAPQAIAAGFRSANALPLVLRSWVVGSLNRSMGARDPPRRPATVPLPPSARHRRHADQAVRT
jgi:hypothetical protein